MSLARLVVSAELPELDESTQSLSWAEVEAWAVAMREELPVAVVAAAFEQLQEDLLERVCGPKWLAVRDLPAPFGCPGCGVMSDFARKGWRTRLRRLDTSAGTLRIRLAHVGCRGCGRVFAPLLLMLDLSGRRRTDRLMLDLADLASQMSFARAGAIAASFGMPGSGGRAHQAVADLAPLLEGIGQPCVSGMPSSSEVVILDGTGMRAGARRLGVNCNIAVGVSARSGPRRRRRATTALLGVTVNRPWSAMVDQLRGLAPPAVVVVDGELAITAVAETVWPDVPIQRCWWHLPRALRWALYADKAPHPWANAKRAELVELLHRVARERLTLSQALTACDAFSQSVTAEGHHGAGVLLAGARDQVFTCLRPEVRRRLASLGGPELGSGVVERVMRELNARTDIGGSRWSVDGLRDLVSVQLARMTNHPTWTTLLQNFRPENKITFTVKTVKFNAG